MCFLYFRIWRETKKRQKDLPNLQGGGGGASVKKDSSKRSNSRFHFLPNQKIVLINFILFCICYSDEASQINHNHQIDCNDTNFWHPPHLENADGSNFYANAHMHSHGRVNINIMHIEIFKF